MSEKKPNNTQILILTIAGAGLIIVILLVLLVTGSSSKNTGTTVRGSNSLSSTKTYVEGKDYSIRYSNSGFVDKATIDKALNIVGIDDYSILMNKSSGAYSKVELLFNKDKNMFILKNYKVGNNEPDSFTCYSIQDKKVLDGRPQTTDYENMPIVYTWTNLTK